jgi:hypothetical protein
MHDDSEYTYERLDYFRVAALEWIFLGLSAPCAIATQAIGAATIPASPKLSYKTVSSTRSVL